MRTTIIERKAIAYDILINLITLILITISYVVALAVLNESVDEQIQNTLVIKNIFIFIVPAALEGMNIFVSTANENKKMDQIDILCSGVCIILCTASAIMIGVNKVCCVELVTVIALVYPVRILAALVFLFLKLLERR